METSPSPRDNSERLEQIVAYLDGELSPEESACVERQLASDEKYRQDLQSIDRAWAALDQLPAPVVDDGFSKTTMELVVGEAAGELQARTQALPIQRRRRTLATALMLGTCALLGMLMFRMIWRNPNRPLIADLPVIQYVDLYSQFEDVAFLRALGETMGEPPWGGDASATQLEQQVEQFKLVSVPDTREDWLDRLAPEEKSALRAKFNRYYGLPSPERQRLRALHGQLAEMGDGPHLSTLVQYHQWLKGLLPIEQYELRQQATAQARADEVAHLFAAKRREAALELSDDQLRELLAAVTKHARQELRKRGREMSDPEKPTLRNPSPEQFLRVLFRTMNQHDMQALLRDMSKALPSDALQQLEKMPQWDRQRQISNWLKQARLLEATHGRQGPVTEEQLEATFAEELPAAMQERLLALSRDEMRERLIRIYRGQERQSDWQMRWRQRPHPRDFGPPLGPPRDRDRLRGDRRDPGGSRFRDGRDGRDDRRRPAREEDRLRPRRPPPEQP